MALIESDRLPYYKNCAHLMPLIESDCCGQIIETAPLMSLTESTGCQIIDFTLMPYKNLYILFLVVPFFST